MFYAYDNGMKYEMTLFYSGKVKFRNFMKFRKTELEKARGESDDAPDNLYVCIRTDRYLAKAQQMKIEQLSPFLTKNIHFYFVLSIIKSC